MKSPGLKGLWKKAGIAALVTVTLLIIIPPILHSDRPMPDGTDVISTAVPTVEDDIRLLIDETSWDDAAGKRIFSQEIFDEILAMITRADQFIYIDMFLWNPWKGSVPEEHRKLSTELAQVLVNRKQAVPDLDIIVLTDPINRIYGEQEPGFFHDMSRAGISVVFTDLSLLPDSNRLYAPYWSLAEKVLKLPLFKEWSSRPRIANPFEKNGPEISLLQFGRMLLFKANHRKVVITGSTDTGIEMLVGSLNPADGSSGHSNMALCVKGKVAMYGLGSELAILRQFASGKTNIIDEDIRAVILKADSVEKTTQKLLNKTGVSRERPTVQWLTEGAIHRTIISLFDGTSLGDEVRIALFYLSDRHIVEAIRRALSRGVSMRLILDANRDAFGMEKIGVPNRPVAAELMKLAKDHSIQVRWADTHGEQFHTKSMSITYGHADNTIFLTGSANWTRRNIANLNLEANLLVHNAQGIIGAYNAYFDRIWENADGRSHTVPYDEWREKGLKLMVKNAVYRFQERWGAGTF
jgi:hypothetical protein